MRRMVSGPILKAPNENNKIFCAQFVADSIVVNDFKPGYYCIRLNDTINMYSFGDFYVSIKEGPTIYTPLYYNFNDEEFCLQLDYSNEVLTIYIYTNGLMTNSDYHIDIFKID